MNFTAKFAGNFCGFKAHRLIAFCLFALYLWTATKAEKITFEEDSLANFEDDFSQHSKRILLDRGRRKSAELANDSSSECPEQCICYLPTDVHCTFTTLERIPAQFPTEVQKINVAYNKFGKIRSRGFDENGEHLKSLSLQSNELKSLPTNPFRKLGILSILRLSWNKLTTIRKSVFQGLHNVERIYLDNNKITFLHPLAFRGLANLKLLQLDGNKLSVLHKSTFITTSFFNVFRHSGIQYLYLSKNEIRTLPSDFFDSMVSLRKVYFHENPWRCSCREKWLRSWMEESAVYSCKQTRMVLLEDESEKCATCVNPPRLNGRVMTDVPVKDFICDAPASSSDSDVIETRFDDEEDYETQIRNEEIALFRFTDLYAKGMSIRLDSNDRSLLLMRCNTTRVPFTKVDEMFPQNKVYAETVKKGKRMKIDGPTKHYYSASYEATLRCNVEYPQERQELGVILQPYLDRAVNFSTLESRVQSENSKQYDVMDPLSDSILHTAITKAEVSSEYRIFMQPTSLVTILSDQFNLEEGSLRMIYNAKVAHTFFPGARDNSDDHWTIIRRPNALEDNVIVTMRRKSTYLYCKAIGENKPKITWILPSDEILTNDESRDKYTVNRAGRLLIRKTDESDAGIYRCIATVACAAPTDDDTLTRSKVNPRENCDDASSVRSMRVVVVDRAVKESLKQKLKNTKEIKKVVGEEWEAKCPVQSSMDSSVAWIAADNNLYTQHSKSKGDVKLLEDGSFSNDKLKIEDSGIYRCIRVNNFGMTESFVKLRVMTEEEHHQLTELYEYEDYYGSNNSTDYYYKGGAATIPSIDITETTTSGTQVTTEVISTTQASTLHSDIESNSPAMSASSQATTHRNPYLNPIEIDTDENESRDFASMKEQDLIAQLERTFAEEGPTEIDVFVDFDVYVPPKNTSKNENPVITPSPPTTVMSTITIGEQPKGEPILPELVDSVDKDITIDCESIFPEEKEKQLQLKVDVPFIDEVDESDETEYSDSYDFGVESTGMVLSEEDNALNIDEPPLTDYDLITAGLVNVSDPDDYEDLLDRNDEDVGDGEMKEEEEKEEAEEEEEEQEEEDEEEKEKEGGEEEEDEGEKENLLFNEVLSTLVPTVELTSPSKVEDRTINAKSEFVIGEDILALAEEKTFDEEKETQRLNSDTVSPIAIVNLPIHDELDTIETPSAENLISAPLTSVISTTETLTKAPPTTTRRPLSGSYAIPTIAQVGIREAKGTIGRPIGLPCPAIGDPTPVIKWTMPSGEVVDKTARVNGVSLFRNGMLFIRSVDDSKVGSYTCTASNIAGSATVETRVVTTGQQYPSIQPFPMEVYTITEGETVTIPCTVKESNVDITWFFPGGNPVPSFALAPTIDTGKMPSKIFVTANRNLRFSALTLEQANAADSGEYTCSARNFVGEKTQTVKVLVEKETEPEVLEVADLKIETVTTECGGKLTLNCKLGKFFNPNLQPKWTFPDETEIFAHNWGTRRRGVTITNNATLLFSGATPRLNGTYKCESTNPPSDSFYNVNVEVTCIRPEIVSPVEETIVVNYGESKDVPCIARGSPRPRIRWNSLTQTVAKFRGNILKLEKVTRNGVYECKAANAAGSSMIKVNVEALVLPPTFVNEVKNVVNVVRGSTGLLDCVVNGVPKPRFTWIGADSSVASTITQARNGSLVIRSAQDSHAKTYKCFVSNIAGSKFRTFKVNVVDPTTTTSTTTRITTTTIPTTTTTDPYDNFQESIVKEMSTRPVEFSAVAVYANSESNRATEAPVEPDLIPVESAPKATAKSRPWVEVPLTSSPKFDITRTTKAIINTTSTTIAAITEPTTTTSLSTVASTLQEEESVMANTSTIQPPTIISTTPRTQRRIVYDRTYSYDKEGYFGTRMRLHCFTGWQSKSRRHPIRVIWTLPRGQRVARYRKTFGKRWQYYVFANGTLLIKRINMRHNGKFSCHVKDKLDRYVRTNVQMKVLYRKPLMVDQKFEVARIATGSKLMVSCVVKGYPPPKITWRAPDGIILQTSSWSPRLTVFSNGSLYFPSVSDSDNGRYTCRAGNVAGNATRVVLIQVPTAAPRFNHPRIRQRYVRVGESIKIPCEVTGSPTPKQTWRLNQGQYINKNQAVFEDGFKAPKIAHTSSGAILINRATTLDSGRYYCNAHNKIKHGRISVILKVYE